MSESTGGATQPTPDAIGRLQQEIVTALAGVDKYYPDAEQQAAHAVKQNRKHVRLILDKIGGIEEAIDYVQLRGVEWCARVEAGMDYTAPTILALLAEDAKETWVKPTNPAAALKKKIKNQIQKQLDNKATWKIRAGWLEEHYRYADVPAPPAAVEAAPAIEESYEREPVALGEIVEQLVPAVRRSPQPAPAATSAQPAWWLDVVRGLLSWDALSGAGVLPAPDLKTQLQLVQMVLSLARVELVEGVAWVSPGAIPATEIGDVTACSKSWERVLTWAVRQQGVAERVAWSIKPRAEVAAPVKVEEPKATPQVHGPRPASARPAWWADLLGYLSTLAGRVQHQEADPLLASRIREMAALLRDARTARLGGGELVVELDSLGALRAVWPALEPHLARGVALYADLSADPRVVVVERAGEEVRP